MDLDSNSIDALEELIHVNIESHQGFKELSTQIEDADCRNLFREIASKRRDHADLLLRHIRSLEHDMARPSSLGRTLHRLWMDLRSSLGVAGTCELLAEAEQGEDAIEKLYERMFREMSDRPLRSLLQAQYREVRHDHYRIQALSERIARSE